MDTQQVLGSLDGGAALVAPSSAAEPVAFQVAGLGERLLAYILDGIYLYLIAFAVGAVLVLAGLDADAETGDASFSLLNLVIAFTYYAYYWRRNGQTPGKHDMGIQIVRVDGHPITVGTVLKRYFGYSINSLILMLGWVALLVDIDHRGWHDRWAGTMVVKKFVGADDSRRQQRGRWRPAIALVGGAIAMCGLVAMIADENGLPPSPARRAFNQADDHLMQGDYDAAMIDLDSALSLDPNMAEAYATRGIVYSAQGDYPRGTADFDTALGLDPHCASAYFGRGYAQFLQSDYASAIGEFNEALRLDAKMYDVYFYRGAAQSYLDERELALADFKAHVRLAGDDAYPLANMMIAQLEDASTSQ